MSLTTPRKRTALKPQAFEIMISESFVLFIETIKLNMKKNKKNDFFRQKIMRLHLTIGNRKTNRVFFRGDPTDSPNFFPTFQMVTDQ